MKLLKAQLLLSFFILFNIQYVDAVASISSFYSIVDCNTVTSSQSDANGNYRIKDNSSDYDIQVRGKIKVNDDDTGISSISAGGSLKVSKKTFSNKRSIIIESNLRD